METKEQYLIILLVSLITLWIYLNGYLDFILGIEPVNKTRMLNTTGPGWSYIRNESGEFVVKMPSCVDGPFRVISTSQDNGDKTPPKLNDLNQEHGIKDTYFTEGITLDDIHTSAFSLEKFNVTFYVPADLGGEALIYVKAGTEDGMRGITTFKTAGNIILGSCNITGSTTGGIKGMWGECTAELDSKLLLPGVNNTIEVSNNVKPDIFGLSFIDYDYLEFKC